MWNGNADKYAKYRNFSTEYRPKFPNYNGRGVLCYGCPLESLKHKGSSKELLWKHNSVIAQQ